jgi:hypothetical protein
MRNAYKISVRNPVGKETLERPTHRWQDKNNVGLKET